MNKQSWRSWRKSKTFRWFFHAGQHHIRSKFQMHSMTSQVTWTSTTIENTFSAPILKCSMVLLELTVSLKHATQWLWRMSGCSIDTTSSLRNEQSYFAHQNFSDQKCTESIRSLWFTRTHCRLRIEQLIYLKTNSGLTRLKSAKTHQKRSFEARLKKSELRPVNLIKTECS